MIFFSWKEKQTQIIGAGYTPPSVTKFLYLVHITHIYIFIIYMINRYRYVYIIYYCLYKKKDMFAYVNIHSFKSKYIDSQHKFAGVITGFLKIVWLFWLKNEWLKPLYLSRSCHACVTNIGIACFLGQLCALRWWPCYIHEGRGDLCPSTVCSIAALPNPCT